MILKETITHEDKDYLIVVDYDRIAKAVESVKNVYELDGVHSKPCNLKPEEIEFLVDGIYWPEVYNAVINGEYEEA